MTEREALLHSIVKDHRERTPLLVYADWLDERHELPAAEATAEFIRLACAGKSLRHLTSPVACLEWLKDNWTRLLPSVAALAKPLTFTPDGYLDAGNAYPDSVAHLFGFGATVTNASIDTLVGIAGNTSRGEKVYPCRLQIKVGFGLLLKAEMKSAWGKKQVWPLLAKDQPQLTMEFPPAEAPAKREKSAIAEILEATIDAVFFED